MKIPSIIGFALLLMVGSCAAMEEFDNWMEQDTNLQLQPNGSKRGPESYITTDVNHIKFILTSTAAKHNLGDVIIKWNDTEKLPAATYDPNADFKFLIHGFTANEKTTFPVNVKEAYVKYAKKTQGLEYNIIVVDWGALAGDPPYLWQYETAKQNVENVGKRVGDMIMNLVKTGVITNLNKVHLVGHSLGAHVSGRAGYQIKTVLQKRIGRISGLDPAGPGFDSSFEYAAVGRPLHLDDAIFVDAYHTNPGSLWSTDFAFGTKHNLGQVDFWPNQKNHITVNPQQPQCKQLLTINRSVCSHSMAHKFFAKSVSEKIEAIKCISALSYSTTCAYIPFFQQRAIFGEHCSPQTVGGSYYLEISIPDEDVNKF